MRRWFLAVLAGLGLSSCNNIADKARSSDNAIFSSYGRTFFSQSKLTSLKEIHLSSLEMIGRTVVVQGKIKKISPHGTFLVLNDGSATLLVVTTLLTTSDWFRRRNKIADNTNLSVLGEIESGTKGLPYLTAQAVAPGN